MLKYQAMLLEQEDAELKVTNLLNPAVFLTTDPEAGELTHNCLQTIESRCIPLVPTYEIPLRTTWTGSCLWVVAAS